MNYLSKTLENTINNFGDNLALCDENYRVNYNQLGKCVDFISAELTKLGVVSGDKVAIIMDKSVMSVASIYGVIKTNATYVPINIESPIDNIHSILEQCDIKLLITSQNNEDFISSLRSKELPVSEVVYLDKDPSKYYSLPKSKHSNVGESELDIGSVATILFTSGSTGKPKGVTISHKNIQPFVEWVVEEYSVTERDRLASHAPLFFDISLLDIFVAAKTGASTFLINSSKSYNHLYLCDLIQKEQITFWQSVPSALKLLSEVESSSEAGKHLFPSIKNILFTGEKLSGKFVTKLTKKFPNANFSNIYGCTETNDTFVYHIPIEEGKDIPDDIPIGMPIPYVSYRILNKQLEDADQGELYINSPTNMNFYHGSDSSPYVILDDQLEYYKTGDVVKIDSKGIVHIKGRTDNIVKINGYRVSLLEIENVLTSFFEVTEAVVFSMEDQNSTIKLVAVIYSKQDDLSKIALRSQCAQKLARYKIPNVLITKTKELPKTQTGKIDRKLVKQIELNAI